PRNHVRRVHGLGVVHHSSPPLIMRLQHLATHRRRSGAVLIVVLVIIAVLGALAAGSFFAALHEERIDSAAIVRARALAAAEHAAYTIISPQRWRAAWSSVLLGQARRVGQRATRRRRDGDRAGVGAHALQRARHC